MPAQNFYLFDIDDNILSLPTEVNLYYSDLKKKNVGITTEEYAKHADFISEKLEEYEFRDTSFDNMSDQDVSSVKKQQLYKDILACVTTEKGSKEDRSWQGPMWDIFKTAVELNRPVAFVTARSHSAETIRASMSLFVEYGYLKQEPNYIGIYAVNNDDIRAELCKAKPVLDPKTVGTPELKRRAIREVVALGIEEYGDNAQHAFAMSDDDKNNIDGVLTAMRELKAEHKNFRFVVVNSGLGIEMVGRTGEMEQGPNVMIEILQPLQSEPISLVYEAEDILENDAMPDNGDDQKEEYKPRDYVSDGRISCQAVAGTKSVLLGLDATEKGRDNLIGFAINKMDKTTGYEFWLGNSVPRFPKPQEGEAGEAQDGKRIRLVQSFTWGDYQVMPGHNYTYKIIPLYVDGDSNEWGQFIEVNICVTDAVIAPDAKECAVFFNRALAGSAGYQKKFGSTPWKDMSEEDQWESALWLSNGLGKAMLDFIKMAKDETYALRGALYELSFEMAVKEFGAAKDRGVDVKICFHKHNGKDDVSELSIPLLEKYGLTPIGGGEKGVDDYEAGAVSIPITHGSISHNKVLLMLKDGKPFAVWTGSTNWTIGAICGHSNVGHAFFDEKLAQQYYNYWEHLAHNKMPKDKKADNEEVSPWNLKESEAANADFQGIFSPRKDKTVLYDYVKMIKESPGPVFITLAFGVGPEMAEALLVATEQPKFVILNSRFYGDSRDDRYRELMKTPNTYVVWGDKFPNDPNDQWVDENLTGLNSHVKYVHTKYFLTDPLGPNPVVVSGSANFSEASTVNNDENMVVIRNNPKVAQSYLSEFMRFFDHFWLRNRANAGDDIPPFTYDDSWTKPYFADKTTESVRRQTLCVPQNISKPVAE